MFYAIVFAIAQNYAVFCLASFSCWLSGVSAEARRSVVGVWSMIIDAIQAITMPIFCLYFAFELHSAMCCRKLIRTDISSECRRQKETGLHNSLKTTPLLHKCPVAQQGGWKGRNLPSPSPIQGTYSRSGLSSIARFHSQHSMKMNNLHALEGPCRVWKDEFQASGDPSQDQEDPSIAWEGPFENKVGE